MRIWVWNKSGSSLEWALVCQLQESKIALQWHMEVERKREKVDFGYWHSLCFSAESCIRHIVIWMHGRFAYAALHDVLYCLYTNRLKSPFQLIPSPLFYINMRMQASIQRGREIALSISHPSPPPPYSLFPASFGAYSEPRCQSNLWLSLILSVYLRTALQIVIE